MQFMGVKSAFMFFFNFPTGHKKGDEQFQI